MTKINCSFSPIILTPQPTLDKSGAIALGYIMQVKYSQWQKWMKILEKGDIKWQK